MVSTGPAVVKFPYRLKALWTNLGGKNIPAADPGVYLYPLYPLSSTSNQDFLYSRIISIVHLDLFQKSRTINIMVIYCRKKQQHLIKEKVRALASKMKSSLTYLENLDKYYNLQGGKKLVKHYTNFMEIKKTILRMRRVLCRKSCVSFKKSLSFFLIFQWNLTHFSTSL